ncbi:hypothetical protein SLA2020_116140 [Shorea laevis]
MVFYRRKQHRKAKGKLRIEEEKAIVLLRSLDGKAERVCRQEQSQMTASELSLSQRLAPLAMLSPSFGIC